MKNLKESEVGTSEISYFELASKLKAAYRAKAKNQDDMYAEVSVHCYCGGPFEMNITCSGLDDMPNEVAFYVTYLAEDDFGFDVGFGMNNLKTTISDYYKANGDPAEMSPRIAIDPSALRLLDEIAAGQGMLFEKKVNEAVEQYVHPTLRKYPDIQDGIFYTCYTLDGDEEESFADFDLFEDAISACRQKTDDTHQATHACIVAVDDHDPDSKDYLKSYGLINYEVVAEFSPDAGEALTEASISKVKKFGTPYLDKIADKAQGIADAIEKENNYKLELCGPEYDAYQTASTVVGTAAYYLNTNHDWRANKKLFRNQLFQLFEDPVEFFGLDCNNGHDGFGDEFFQACHEDGIMPYMRKYIKESDILEALDFVEKEVYQNKINTGKEKELLRKSIERDRKDREEREARYAAQAAKFDRDTKFLQDAAKTAKVVIDEIEGYSRPDDWSVILDTEDEYKANTFRNAVGDLLEGTENAYGASYDDIPGMGSIHLGCVQYYEWSEMNGGDVYDDLDESIREKYVVFACPKKKWIDYRRRTDC